MISRLQKMPVKLAGIKFSVSINIHVSGHTFKAEKFIFVGIHPSSFTTQSQPLRNTFPGNFLSFSSFFLCLSTISASPSAGSISKSSDVPLSSEVWFAVDIAPGRDGCGSPAMETWCWDLVRCSPWSAIRSRNCQSPSDTFSSLSEFPITDDHVSGRTTAILVRYNFRRSK